VNKSIRKRKFIEGQPVNILREADKTDVADVDKKCGVSDQPLYKCRKRFGSMDVDEAKRLKTLEAENQRLKKITVERDLAI
jgi:putative transposase